ncbi:MAG: sugar transferase [Desulfovibrionaceae bacterium]
MTPGDRAAKRLLDLALTIPALALLSPVLLAVALAVRLGLGPGVLFRQPRPGLHGRPFTMLKFRTMRRPAPGREAPEYDAERLTRLGRFLRRTSLDELPELLNVLAGHMSLVGPRPLLMQYLSRYNAHQARRMDMPPGITGWAQVNGRNALSWEEKFDLDVWYVDHWSLGLDLKILAMTVGGVLSGRGVSQPGAATMREFMGSTPETTKQGGADGHGTGR